MMQITVVEVRKAFEGIIAGKLDRKDVSSWCSDVLAKQANGELDIVPCSDEEKVVDGIMFLIGADYLEKPDKYRYSIQDFEDKIKNLFGHLKVHVSIANVRQVFEQLISGKLSREDASKWAADMLENDERGVLEVVPGHDSPKVFRGLTYLIGVDLLESPGRFLHSMANFNDEMLDLFGP